MTASINIERSLAESAVVGAGAPADESCVWSRVDWERAYGDVRRLQTRIAKAANERRWGKVKALQHLLVHSRSAKALAVRQVVENRGRKIAGVDGEVWDTPEAKSRAIRELGRRGHEPMLLRRILVPKSDGTTHPLGIPTMRDRAMQALWKLAAEPVSEATADANSYGFRPGRSVHDAIEQCFIVFSRRTAPEWVLEGRVKGCLEHVSRDWLLQNAPMDRGVLKAWLNAGHLDDGTLIAGAGASPGGPISPVLANVTLDGLERTIHERFILTRNGKRNNVKVSEYKVNVIRYADGFVVSGSSREFLEAEVRPVVDEFLAARDLRLREGSTRVVHIDEGFDFLGFNVRKYGGKLLIQPSKESVKALLRRVREEVRKGRTATQRELLSSLNPIIRGWANQYKHCVAGRTFSAVDERIWRMLWHWARRRHSNKGNPWVLCRYFRRSGSKAWVFAVTTETGRSLALRRTSDVRIIRHVKVRNEASVFDPAWDEYFEQRRGVRFRFAFYDRARILRLWKRQSGACPVCKQPIAGEGFHRHHVVRRRDGGTDDERNLVLVHEVCHSQIHTADVLVGLPGPEGPSEWEPLDEGFTEEGSGLCGGLSRMR